MGAAKSSFVNLVAMASQLVATLIVSIFLARILGPESFGIYRTLRSVPAGLLGITAFIPGVTVIFFTSYEKNKTRVFWTIAGLISLITIPAFLVLLFASPWIAGFYGVPTSLLVLVSFEVLFLSYYPLTRGFLKGSGDFVKSTLISLVNNFFRILIVLAAFFGLFFVFLWRDFYWFLTYVFIFWILRKKITHPIFDKVLAKKILRYNVFLMVSNALRVFSTNFIILFLGKLSATQTSFYSIAFFLASLITSSSTALMEVGLVRVANTSKNKSTVYTLVKISKYTTYLSGFLAISFIGFGREIIRLLLSDKYLGAVMPLYITTFAMYLASAFSGTVTAVLKNKDTHFHMFATIFRTIVLLATAPLLIPKYLAIGAALSFLLSLMASSSVLFIYSRIHKLHVGLSYALRSFIAAIFSIIIGKFISFQLPTLWSLFVVPPISFGIYLLGLFLLNGFDDYDRSLALSAVQYFKHLRA